MLNRKFKFDMSRQNIMYLALLIVAALVLFSWAQTPKVVSKYDMMPEEETTASTMMAQQPIMTSMAPMVSMPPMGSMAPMGSMGPGAGELNAGIEGWDISSIDMMNASIDLEGSNMDMQSSCAAQNGVGLSSSLLPREVASQENYGEFSPDDILKGQSFLNPRDQVGYPETLGGTLRNANQQIRADPPNPKRPYVWQNSTIVPDVMQRTMCT